MDLKRKRACTGLKRTSEAEEQRLLFDWARMAEGRWPCLRLMHHVPNGGRRDAKEAAMLRREGVRAGVPDICLPVASSGFHGLYIELKRRDGGRVSNAQAAFLRELIAQGYCAAVCHGFEEARALIERYLKGDLYE